MKSSKTNHKIAPYVLCVICFTAYLFILFSVLANTLDPSLYHSLLS
jgi:hypothetical protein